MFFLGIEALCHDRPAALLGKRLGLLANQSSTDRHFVPRGEITVLGGAQTRPNIHIRDLVRVFEHFIALGDRATGIYNAGFENLSILDIARAVTRHVRAEIRVAESNDPRSYSVDRKSVV